MKRWAMRITICLLLGLITTVAVAWACAVWVNVGEGDLRQGWHGEDDLQWMRGWRLSRRDAFGTHRLLAMARRTVPSSQQAPPAISSRDELTPWWSGARQAMDDQVRTVRKEEARRESQGDTTTVRPTLFYDDARGWPLPALWCRWDSGLVPGGPEDGKLLHGGIELEPVKPQRPGTRNGDDQRALPLWPIWRGVAVDCLFYALIWFVPLGGVGFVRRELRRAKGHCIKCGYDLSHAEHEACPECGVEVSRCPTPSPAKRTHQLHRLTRPITKKSPSVGSLSRVLSLFAALDSAHRLAICKDFPENFRPNSGQEHPLT